MLKHVYLCILSSSNIFSIIVVAILTMTEHRLSLREKWPPRLATRRAPPPHPRAGSLPSSCHPLAALCSPPRLENHPPAVPITAKVALVVMTLHARDHRTLVLLLHLLVVKKQQRPVAAKQLTRVRISPRQVRLTRINTRKNDLRCLLRRLRKDLSVSSFLFTSLYILWINPFMFQVSIKWNTNIIISIVSSN